MIIMTKGIVKIKKNRAFVEQQNGEVEVASGQCVYEKTGVIYFEKNLIYRNRRHNRFEEDGKWSDSADYAGGVIVLYSGGGKPL